MRIIGGSARGRRLLTPRHARVRPTADRVKEALFNIIAARFGPVEGCRVLDLFAGTGNLGIESLSRGAAAAVFVDQHRESVALIRRNLELTGFSARALLVEMGVSSAIAALGRKAEAFDLVFLDPPYGTGLAGSTLGLLAASPLIQGGSLVVAEFSQREVVPESFGELKEVDRRTYGDTVLAFYVPSG